VNNNFIKSGMIFITTVFLLLLVNAIYMNEDDKDLLYYQIEVEKINLLHKDLNLKLNDVYRSNYVNYDSLNKSVKMLKWHVEKLSIEYPQSDNLDEITKLISMQNNNIDLIKRSNSIINNSFNYIKFLPTKIIDYNTKELKEITSVLIDLSYEIKFMNKTSFTKYKDAIQNFKNIELHNLKLIEFKESMLPHLSKIYENAIILQENISLYESSKQSVINNYLKLNDAINKKNIIIKQKIIYSKTTLLILLIVLISLVYKLLRKEKKYINKQKELQQLINKNIITSTTDLMGNIIEVSDAYCNISGYSRDELIGNPQSIIRHPDMEQSLFKNMWVTIQSGNTWKGNIKNIKKDGAYYWVDLVIEPIYNSKNEVESYLGISINITDKIKLDKLTQSQKETIKKAISNIENQKNALKNALETKSEFLANMSHEIRTPLNAIIGFIDILKEENKNEKSQEYLDIIDSSSKSLVQIIEDILDFSKIESGKIDIEKIDFNTIKEFEITTYLFKAKASEKNILLSLNLDKNLPKYINSDPLRIKQVMSNLLSNAIKFTNNHKKIDVNIKYENNFLYVSVIDQGKGIAENKLEHIFESFSQEDSSTTREFGGTGLGLSISSELVKLLGGELKVKSKPEVGSEFYFFIPAEIGKELLITDTYKADSNFNDKVVLLVEDNKANQMFMKVILKKQKLKFDIANDGVEAIEAFKSKKYDLILMDENMPNMNGIEATKHILEMEKIQNLQHTPIIALTANALKGDREKFLSAGMDEYMTKPVDKNIFSNLLSLFLK